MKTCKLTHRTSGAVTASRIAIAAGLGSLALAGTASAADPVLEWNKQAVRLTVAATKSPPLGNHILAMTQTAVYLAGNAITRRYPAGAHAVDGTASASLEAGVASASYRMLVHLLPRHAQPIEAAYSAAIRSLGDSQAVRDGLGIGERAFEATLRWRQSLAVPPAKPYRPATAPGVYVPTQRLAGVGWGDRATWILSSSSELRPPAPPALDSATWARDYNEVLTVGASQSGQRTAAQSEIARFWVPAQPTIYYPVLWSIAAMPGRDAMSNARLLAIAAQAMDDAIVSVFEAKYHYRFWRPETAIANGDADGNDATQAVAGWASFIPAPMHPEYPCAHCIVSATLAGVIERELNGSPSPRLSTTSAALPGVEHSWETPRAFAQEVSESRIAGGIHYRNSTEVGQAMGARVAELAFERALGK